MSKSQSYYRRKDWSANAGPGDSVRRVQGESPAGSAIAIWREKDIATYDRFVRASLEAGALTGCAPSSDGGVLATYITCRRSRFKHYARTAGEAEECWTEWADWLEHYGYIPDELAGGYR